MAVVARPASLRGILTPMVSSLPPKRPAPGRAIRSLPAYLGLLLLSHILLVLSFPYPGWAPVAHAALVPAAVLAVRADRARRLVWTGFLISFLWWVYMIRWLQPVTGGGFVALAAYLAVYAPAALLLLRWLSGRSRMPVTLALPLAWVSLEMIRGVVLAGGFGWYALAHSQAAWRVGQEPGRIVQVADLFGQYGVSFLVAMSNGLLCDLILGLTAGRGGPRRHGLRLAAAVWVSAYAGAWFYGQFRLTTAPDDAAPTVRVAVIQTNIPQDNKVRWTPESDERMWAPLERLTLEAASQGSPVDLVVWPESATPQPINTSAARWFVREAEGWQGMTAEQLAELDHDGALRRSARQLGVDVADLSGVFAARYRKWAAYGDSIAELAREARTPIVVGSLTRHAGRPPARYNSVYLYRSDGSRAADRYDKMHLVPFGEFVPWVGFSPRLHEWFIRALTPYDSDYTLNRGATHTVFRLGADVSEGDLSERRNVDVNRSDDEAAPLRFATPICFEDTVARVIRPMVYDHGRKRVDLLVNVTNDGWFTGSAQPVHHMQAAVLRCIENRVPMARSVNTGPSGYVDSTGRIGSLVDVDGRSQDCEGIAIHDVTLDSRHTFYGRWGRIPIILALALTGAVAVRGTWRRQVR